MVIVGFGFTKILGEKKGPARGKVKINNNVAIKDVQDANLSMGQGKKGLKIHFLFETRFSPELGNLTFEGDVVVLENAKTAEGVMAEWKKNKRLPKEMMPNVLNHVLERTNIQALLTARDLGLPAPVPLPKVNVQQPEKKPAKPAKKKK